MPPKTRTALADPADEPTPAPVAPDVTVPSDTPTEPQTSAEVVDAFLAGGEPTHRWAPLTLDPLEVGYVACLDAGQNPFEGFPIEQLRVALATALDELKRLQYQPETGYIGGDELCSHFPGGWDNPAMAKFDNVTCGEHGRSWNRPA